MLEEPRALTAPSLLAAVVAILGQPGVQVLHTRLQRQVLFAQALILGFELGNPNVGRNVSAPQRSWLTSDGRRYEWSGMAWIAQNHFDLVSC
jgi:hypothetical protein